MEMTEDQKEKQREYNKEWREKNPDKISEYRKRAYEKHRTYYHNYYLEHKEEMLENSRLWREANKGDYVYFYIDKNGTNIYIGSTGGRPFVERTSFHLNSHSNLKMSAEDLVNDYNLECILYKDFSKYNLSREDLYAIEKSYKEEQGSILNKQPIIVNEENLTRSMDELIEIAEKIPYQEFDKLDRYLN